jgi:histidinol-phosphatase (PHP family)
MLANYHTHTWRCNHAEAGEEAYILAALDQGFEILGFADHTPCFFPGDYYSGFRMRPEQLTGYCDTVRGLRDKYASKIRIHLGLETEFYPSLIGDLLPFLRDQGVEYLLLGQHFTGDEVDGVYVGLPTEDRAVLKQYVRQSLQAMNTGLFTYFAHPDVIRFLGDDRFYREQMWLLCREAALCGIPLEMNLLGVWSKRNYPDRRFWELAAEAGCKAVLGWDAHAPEHLRKPREEALLRSWASELGLNALDQVKLQTF